MTRRSRQAVSHGGRGQPTASESGRCLFFDFVLLFGFFFQNCLKKSLPLLHDDVNAELSRLLLGLLSESGSPVAVTYDFAYAFCEAVRITGLHKIAMPILYTRHRVIGIQHNVTIICQTTWRMILLY